MNKAMSLIVVLTALPARLAAAGVLAAVVIVAVLVWLLRHGGSNPSSGRQGANHVPRTRSAASGSAGPGKRGAVLTRKLLAMVLTWFLWGWLLQGCGPGGCEMTPSTASTLQRDVRRGVLGRRRLPLGRCHRRTGSIGGRRGERPGCRRTVQRAAADPCPEPNSESDHPSHPVNRDQ